ncbi:MAG: polysaccharide pyruvyl transferase family protein, partial [Candidatus Paceibacterota bacterium]
MQKINSLIQPIIHRVPIYALSIGFPYVGLVNDQTLKIFDFVGYRTQLDTNAITEMYGPNRVQYYPDLAWLLPRWSSKKINSTIFQDVSIIQENKNEKKVGIFLSNTIRNRNDLKSYNRILNNLAYCISKMADYKLSSKLYSKLKNKCTSGDGASNAKVYQIYLISFSTNSQNPKEDDRLINADLYSRIMKYSSSSKGKYNNVHLIESNVPVDEILPIFKNFYMTICTRFHAHIFSMIAKVPFLSIYSSRKVEDILTSHNLHEYSVKMDTNPVTMHPINLDTNTLIERFKNLVEKYNDYKNQLDRIYIQNIVKIDRFYDVMGNLIWTPLRNGTIDSANFQYQIDMRIKDIATKIVKTLFPHQSN